MVTIHVVFHVGTIIAIMEGEGMVKISLSRPRSYAVCGKGH